MLEPRRGGLWKDLHAALQVAEVTTNHLHVSCCRAAFFGQLEVQLTHWCSAFICISTPALCCITHVVSGA